jgi:hypothetical protein
MLRERGGGKHTQTRANTRKHTQTHANLHSHEVVFNMLNPSHAMPLHTSLIKASAANCWSFSACSLACIFFSASKEASSAEIALGSNLCSQCLPVYDGLPSFFTGHKQVRSSWWQCVPWFGQPTSSPWAHFGAWHVVPSQHGPHKQDVPFLDNGDPIGHRRGQM